MWILNLPLLGIAQKVATESFHGSKATLKEYEALYVLNESGDKKIRAILRNINNALETRGGKGIKDRADCVWRRCGHLPEIKPVRYPAHGSAVERRVAGTMRKHDAGRAYRQSGIVDISLLFAERQR